MNPGLWTTLTYRDADAAIAWLKAVGFSEKEVYRDDQDAAVVVHAELLWPAGGGVMLGTYRPNPEWPKEPGKGSAYALTDDVDGVYEAAMAAGARSLHPPRDQSYGGRSAAVADPEGNIWSFGSYGA